MSSSKYGGIIKTEVVGSIPAFARFFALRLCSHNFFSVWASRQINYFRGKKWAPAVAQPGGKTRLKMGRIWSENLIYCQAIKASIKIILSVLVYRHSDVTYWINDSILVPNHFFFHERETVREKRESERENERKTGKQTVRKDR